MAISISDFKSWAGQNQRTAVAVNNGALDAASHQIGFFDRIFRRGTVNSVRSTVMKDFTRALSARYGVTIAQQAISMAGLSAKSELTGKIISEVVGNAKRLRTDMLKPVAAKDLRLGEATVARTQFGSLGRDGGVFLTKFLKQRAVAVELLGEIPLSQADYEDFHARATDLIARLRAKANGNIPARVPVDGFRAEVDALIKAVSDKDAQMRDLLAGQPLGETNIQEYKNLFCDAAVKALESMRVAAGDNAAAAAAIGRVIERLSSNPQARQSFVQRVPLSKNVLHDLAPVIIRMVKEELEQAHARGFRMNESAVLQRLNAGYRQIINERPWPVISKTLSASVGNRPVEITSTIMPAEQLGHSPQSPRGPIADGYPESVHGYMCHSADANHAVNLAVSKLTVADPAGAPKLVFCGVRHGVHSAWEILDDEERATANAHRVEEAVIAAFMAKYAVPEAPAELPQPGQDNVITVDLDITSVALLTPDKTRHWIAPGSATDERRMLMDQTDAWDSVSRNGVTFQFNGRQIRVQPRVVTFNVGVNEGAVKLSGIAPNRAGGWDISDGMNARAFKALTNEVMAFLNDKTADANAKAAVFTLFNQCRNVFQLKGERVDSHDAYKVAARLAVLSQLIGKVPCWNCKSGKDRTGEMDVECKFLSVLIARGEKIPAPGAKLTAEQKGLFRAIALQGGNFEVQKMNVGVAGFKTGSVDSIAERLGGKKYRNLHRGGSDHVLG